LPVSRNYQHGGWSEPTPFFDTADSPVTANRGYEILNPNGAPVRLRVATQMGYKSMKFLRRLVVTDEFVDPGRNGPIQNGWSWYAGI
jgi:hypothetical protein